MLDGLASTAARVVQQASADEELQDSQRPVQLPLRQFARYCSHRRLRRSSHRCQRRRLQSAWLYQGRNPLPRFRLATGRGPASTGIQDSRGDSGNRPSENPDGVQVAAQRRLRRLRGDGGICHLFEGAYRSRSRQIANDITERKRAEEKANQLLAELDRSNKELEQFAYVASHDLQEPLRMVSSYTQLLSRRYKGQLDANADEFIAFAVDGATRMQTLINDLLAYSRVGTRGKEFEPTDCEAVFELALANLKAAIEESSAVVTRGPLPTVMADKMQFGQLLQNLIGNAVKYRGTEPPRVHVAAEQKENDWLFSIRDNGIGIDPQYAERIFVIFQRLHTREEYSGTGIGLAICKKIVERHGGRIWVESQLGSGATFSFTIPAGDTRP